MIDPYLIRKDFPIFSDNLIYLDNAATSQRPRPVIQAIVDFYERKNANVHRGVYKLSQDATDGFEAVRGKVARFLGAANVREIIFTKGTTEGINLIASTWGEANIQPGDVIAVTRMEHHSNFVPWQQLSLRKKARFEIIELGSDFRLDPSEVERVLAMKPKLLSLTLISNVTGVTNPVSEIAKRFSAVGTTVVCDAAQGIAHGKVTIESLGPVSFVAFSAHKMCGPTGVGVLWGKENILEKMPPYQFGGNMIMHVTDAETQFNELPAKFEAGTADIAGVFGLGAAVDYLDKIGRDEIAEYEHSITVRVLEKLKNVNGIQVVGPTDSVNRAPIFSFAVQGVHAHDLATYFDMKGIAVRAGHHCAHPFMQKLGAPATCRASFSFYNTSEEIDLLIDAASKAKEYFAPRARTKPIAGAAS